MSQIQYYKKIIHDNIVNYVLRNASDKSEEDQKNLIESYEKSADSFLDRLKNYTQYHLDDYNFPLGLSKKDKEEKKKYLKDIIFQADYNTPSQIVLFGKKHNDYYQVNINNFQNLIINNYLKNETLRSYELDKLILKIFIYYQVVAYGEIITTGNSFSAMSASHYFGGRSIGTNFIKYIQEILFVLLIFGTPLLFAFNSYFNWSNNSQTIITFTSIWYLIFFPRYILNKYFKYKEISEKDKNYLAYNNLWINCFSGKIHLNYMKNTLQNLIVQRNMIFESGLQSFLQYLIDKYGEEL